MATQTALDLLVQSYEEYLLTLPQHFARFRDRLRDQPAAAQAEAAVFGFLRAEACEPMINEDLSTGGADFCCRKPSPFVVEVTSLSDESFAERAGLSVELPEDGTGSFVDLQNVLNLIRTTISKKASQLANYPVPRLLVICAQFWGASIFVNQSGIEDLFYGGSKISVPIGPTGATGPAQMTTELQDAIFLRFNLKDGRVEPCRQSVSAVLFVHLASNACYALGVLHPDPKKPFQIKNLPTIPFARLHRVANRITIEWSVARVEQRKFSHEAFKLSDKELREGIKAASGGCGSVEGDADSLA